MDYLEIKPSNKIIEVEIAPTNGKLACVENLTRFLGDCGYRYRILGRATSPEAVTLLGKWTIVPAGIDATTIPDDAMAKVTAIFAHGFRPKGFLLIHETTRSPNQEIPLREFTLPSPSWFEQGTQGLSQLETIGKHVFENLKTVLPVIALGLAIVTGLIVLINVLKFLLIGATLLLGAIFFISVTGLDPILVVVTDDDYWIEIARWVS